MHLEIQQSQEYTFEWSFFDKDIKQIPVSGTITITKQGGTALVDETAVSIETDGTIKYTISAENTATLARNYRIELKYQVGDVVSRPFYLFDVVKTPIINEVRDEDLFTHLPELRTKVKSRIIETSSAGSTTTFVAKELIATGLDYKGGYSEIYIDDTTTHEGKITDYESDTGTATFEPSYSASISSGLKVSIRASYQRMIDDAYNNFVSKDIRNRVGLKAGYIDSTVTRNITVYKTLELISFGKVEDVDDKWDIRAKGYARKYEEELTKLSEPYDYNEDGQISSYEDINRPSFINRGINR